MLRFVVTPGHDYTLRALTRRAAVKTGLAVQILTYPALFSARKIPPGTWIMTDLERLAIWELRLAGDIAHQIRGAGPQFRLLNDPARAACRYELLLRLHKAGFNKFRAWRAEDGIPEARFPVFLRLESNHEKPVSGLIGDAKDLAAALEALQRAGVSLRGLLIVEYQAEAIAPGVFRKFAAYRIGEAIVADHLVHDLTWLAKYGHESAWSAARYAEEAEYVRQNPHAEALMRAFTIAGIDYGRADYGIVNGEVQIWEINTNPTLPGGDVRKAPALRADATRVAWENRRAAFQTLDSALPGFHLGLTSEALGVYRGWQRWWLPYSVRN